MLPVSFNAERLAREVKDVLDKPTCVFPVAVGAMRYVDKFESALQSVGFHNYKVVAIKQGPSSYDDPIRKIVSSPEEVEEQLADFNQTHPDKTALIFDDDAHTGQSVLGAICFVMDNAASLGINRIYTSVLSDDLGVANFAYQRNFERFIGPHELLKTRAPDVYEGCFRSRTLAMVDDDCYGALSRYYKWLKARGYESQAKSPNVRLCRELGEELVDLCNRFEHHTVKLHFDYKNPHLEYILSDYLAFNDIGTPNDGSSATLPIYVVDAFSLRMDEKLKKEKVVVITTGDSRLRHSLA